LTMADKGYSKKPLGSQLDCCVGDPL
jgi:hypothetical protein